MLEIKVKWLKEQLPVKLPQKASEGSSGYDLCAALDEPLLLQPGERKLVPTGLALELPHGYEVQVRPRSGLALKHGITVLNAPGTIDADYRGEIGVILINLGQEPFRIHPGDRIAQMVISRTEEVMWKVVEELTETERGEGGFGHSGLRG